VSHWRICNKHVTT